MSRCIGRFLLGFVWIAGVAGAQQDPGGPLLVSPEWLKEHLEDRNLVILHVGDETKFGAGHIPGEEYSVQFAQRRNWPG